MATFTDSDQDVLKTCPYNPVHKIASRRFQQHVSKCAKSGMGPNLAVCPYNASHRVPHNELKSHLASCPDGSQVIREAVDKTTLKKERDANPDQVPLYQRPLASEPVHGNCDWDEGEEKYVLPAFRENSVSETLNREDLAQFVDPMVLSRMKPAQRKAFYADLVEKAKIKQSQQPLLETEEAYALRAGPIVQPPAVESFADDSSSVATFRAPKPRSTHLGGIGRGIVPSASSASSEVKTSTIARSSETQESSAYYGIGRGIGRLGRQEPATGPGVGSYARTTQPVKRPHDLDNYNENFPVL